MKKPKRRALYRAAWSDDGVKWHRKLCYSEEELRRFMGDDGFSYAHRFSSVALLTPVSRQSVAAALGDA